MKLTVPPAGPGLASGTEPSGVHLEMGPEKS